MRKAEGPLLRVLTAAFFSCGESFSTYLEGKPHATENAFAVHRSLFLSFFAFPDENLTGLRFCFASIAL